jgi:hypothetical protein
VVVRPVDCEPGEYGAAARVIWMRGDPAVPELRLQYQVERTAEGRLVKGQSGKPARGDTRVPVSHAACTAEI